MASPQANGAPLSVAQIRANQNFALAVPAGLVAALAGAILWAGVVYFTHVKLGLIVVAVGVLVGYAIRAAGNGVDQKFGILGGACAALGWALGTALTDVAFLAQGAGRSALDVVQALSASQISALMARAADPMDLVFLAIAVWEGYKFSFKYKLKAK